MDRALHLSPNKLGAMLKWILSLLPLKGGQNKAQRHQCSTWGEAGVPKAPSSHPVPWKLDVLHVVSHSLTKTLWLCYGTRISLLRGNIPPLRYHPRLSPVCSTDMWWLCSLLPGILHLQKGQEVPALVKQAVTSGSFPGWGKLMAWACSPALGTCSICLAVMQKVGGTTRQKARLLQLCVFADIQKWVGALDTGSQPPFFQARH